MNDTTRDELALKVGREIDIAMGNAIGIYDGQLHTPWQEVLGQATEDIIALVTAARDAEIRELLLTHADGYIVAKGQDGEAEAAFATKPWMEQILDAIGLHGDETGGQG